MIFQDPVMPAYHDHRFAALSVLVSIVAAYAARDLTERVRQARGRSWVTWLVSAAIVDGIGIWSMHYTGKLALRLPVSFWLDWPTVLLSLLVGILGSARCTPNGQQKGYRMVSGFGCEHLTGWESRACITHVDRLQKQRAYLNELFEQVPQAVVLMSEDNRVVRVNCASFLTRRTC